MHVNTVVIGAGHAGLAVSRCLSERGVEHVVLERGRVAERWRSARWDSFRLITPAWMLRLPGHAYDGGDPDAFLTAAEVVSYLDGYARAIGGSVQEATTVTEVSRSGPGYLVRTDRGDWRSTNVVIATGYHSRPRIPALAAGLPPDLVQANPATYRRPADLPDGTVLVVGASASGVQFADELATAGRDVVLAVGAHTALPRRYRDRDILWWLDRTGALNRTIDDAMDPDAARREPSLQLAGSDRPVDLRALQERGVRLAGRLVDADPTEVSFADDLGTTTAAATARLRRVLVEIDEHAVALPGIAAEPPPLATFVPRSGPRRLNLRRAGIAAVIWATGFRPAYPWLTVPVLDADGLIRHRRGVTAAPGLVAIGLRFQHRRNATFIDGARHDAAFIADHLVARRFRENRIREVTSHEQRC
jgi:putative flavoprotein involved in K+ transport